MKFSIKYADIIVGTLALLALAILVFVIIMLGSNQRWFARDYEYTTYFSSATGLNINMSVQYKGFTIGHVKKFWLNENDEVEVIFTIYKEENHRVKKGSMVELQVSPIGLGNSFVFHPGNGPGEPDGGFIPEINSEAANILIQGMFANPIESNDSINNIISQVNITLDTINKAITGSDSDNPEIGKIISNINDLTMQLKDTFINIDSFTEKVLDPSSSVMSFLDPSNSIYTDITLSLDSVTGILGNLERTSDFMPSQVPLLIADLNKALRSLQDVLTAASNNPLLRRGVPEQRDSSPGGMNPRDLNF